MTKEPNKARQYKPSTIRRLDLLSSNQCAEPNCTKKLVAEDGISIISKICHIEAASAQGPRYNPNMNDDERRDFNNLILLCDEHHIMIDNKENESIYTVDLLREWKEKHEKKALYRVVQSRPLSRHPLALNKVIDTMAASLGDSEEIADASRAPNTEMKISFNNIVKYAPIIQEMSLYQGRLNKIYSEIEKQGSTRKLFILNGLRQIYLAIKVDYYSISEIQNHADDILDQVKEKALEKILNAPNPIAEIDIETLDFCLLVIIVDAFVRCKILEEPVYDS